MRIRGTTVSLVAGVALTCGAGSGFGWASATGCSTPAAPFVTVWLANSQVAKSSADSTLAVAYAQRLASEIFAGVGVKLEWREGVPGDKAVCADTLTMKIDPSAPSSAGPLAMAYATVGRKQEVAIHLLYDRIKATRSPALQRKLLAHVMVHEITHVLEGIARHSSEGIMKAQWDDSDYMIMAKHPLPFAEEDIRLVHAHFSAGATSQSVPGAICSASPWNR